VSGLKGRSLKLPATGPLEHNICVSAQIVASGTYDLEQDAMLALRPFYDKLYDACGLAANTP